MTMLYLDQKFTHMQNCDITQKDNAKIEKNTNHRHSVDPLIIAHRGFNDTYPENSINAFKEALNHNCRFLETDINLTSDNVYILFHDDVSDGHPVIDLTYNAINKITPVDKFDNLMMFLINSKINDFKLILDIKFTNLFNSIAEGQDHLYSFLRSLLGKYQQLIQFFIFQVTIQYVNIIDQLLKKLSLRDICQISWLPDFDYELDFFVSSVKPYNKTDSKNKNNEFCDLLFCDIIMCNYLDLLDQPDFDPKGYQIYIYTVNDPILIVSFKSLLYIKGIVTDKSINLYNNINTYPDYI